MTPSWGVGILTWNDPLQCLATVEALTMRLQGRGEVYVFDNGSAPPMAFPLMSQGVIWPVWVVHSPENLGAGGGLSALIRHMISEGRDHLLFLEDDWLLERRLSLKHLDPFLGNATVGQVRLAQRAQRLSEKYWTYGLTNPDEIAAARAQAAGGRGEYPAGTYHRGRFFWSSNPFACTRAVAERFLLDGLHELALGRPYYDADLATITTFPGYFRHVGEIRERRERPGWRK